MFFHYGVLLSAWVNEEGKKKKKDTNSPVATGRSARLRLISLLLPWFEPADSECCFSAAGEAVCDSHRQVLQLGSVSPAMRLERNAQVSLV